MTVYALILAGGEGTRFAPLSTPERPKQFLALVGEQSLLRQTANRIQSLISPHNWWVATNARYHDLVQNELPEISADHIIGEIHKKNTAPAIALVAMLLYRLDPDAVMVVLPSDHVILNEAQFLKILQQAIAHADTSGELVTLGITPTWASSNYGYIEEGAAVGDGIFKVSRFVEKPDAATARQYLESGRFVWNSGMFVWCAHALLDEVRDHLPLMHELLQSLHWDGSHLPESELKRFFSQVEPVSIDYGIMEKSHHCAVIPAEFGWNDVGTWESLKQLVDSGAVRIRDDVRDHLRQQTQT